MNSLFTPRCVFARIQFFHRLSFKVCISSLAAKGQQLLFGKQANKQAVWMQTDQRYCDDTKNPLSSTQSKRSHFSPILQLNKIQALFHSILAHLSKLL